MKQKMFLFGIASAIVWILWMEGRNVILKETLEILLTKWKLTEEELHFALTMLTTEERARMVKFFQENHAFLKTVFPSMDV